MRGRGLLLTVLSLVLAAGGLVVTADSAAAVKAAPWRWKVVASGSTTINDGQSAEIVLACPAGYRPVMMEWRTGDPGYSAGRMAEYVDYTGNWGLVRLSNFNGFPIPVYAWLNCVHGDDIGTITTVGVTHGRIGNRSGGYTDCPANTRPLSFGADWEGFSIGRTIDFATPTENGWYATGRNTEAGTNLYLEVHCVSTAVFQAASYVTAQSTNGPGSTPTVTAYCPEGKRVVGHGAFQYVVGQSVDPFSTAQGSVESSLQDQGEFTAGGVTRARTPGTGSPNSFVTVSRAYCVWASVPNLLVYTGPSGDVYSQTVSYTFTGSDPVGEAVSFTCSLDGGAAPCTPGAGAANSVSGLAAGFHTMSIKVTNDSFRTDVEYLSFTVVLPPGAPTVTTSTPSTGAVSVAFTPGSTNGGPVTGYTAECVSTDGGLTATAGGTASPIQVTGLTDDKHYHCRVRATNSAGDGPYGAFGDTVLAASVPGAVTVSTSTPGKESVAVGFAAGTSGGSPITGYGVECVSTDGGATGTATGPTGPLAVGGLTAGSTYHCRVRATNAVGDGPYGAFGADVLVPEPPPGPGVGTMAPGFQSMRVGFSATGTGGSPLTGYGVECVSTDGGGSNVATGPSSPLTVHGLTPLKTYHCRVRATNLAGTGEYGAFGPLSFVPTTPSRPTVAKTKKSGATALRVKIGVTNDGGAPPTAYTASCRSRDGGKAGQATGAKRAVKVTGLTPGRTYRCRVRVTNVAGTSQWSKKGKPVTLPAARSATRS